MREIASFVALNRFGLGAAPGDDARLGGDPRGWVLDQIVPTPAVSPVYRQRRGSSEILQRIYTARQDSAAAGTTAIRQAFRSEFNPSVLTRARLMIASRTPFVDRMTLFWSNHFTVSTARRVIGAAIPAYEREVIVPHVFGRFADMLKAVCQHPCMLVYLDNAASIGPDSPVGLRRASRAQASALNENLAREVLELHTLGVGGGYSQTDIIEFAKVLSGWGHGGNLPRGDTHPVHGGFAFRSDRHQPGSKTILGRTYPEAGVAEGLAVLDDLARHPSTAYHVATKLVRHFVADVPPDAAVAHVARVFLDTDGDLGAVMRAVIGLDVAWADPLAKVKSAYEFVIGVHRAAGRIRASQRDVFLPLQLLAQFPFSAPTPQGWGDTAADWVAPEALMRRVEWVRGFAAVLPASLIPARFLDDVIGPVASPEVQTWVDRAPSGDAALAMIFASPEFQRR